MTDGQPAAFNLAFLKRLWPFVRPYRRAFGWCLLILVASFGLELAGPYLVKQALDGPLTQRGDEARSELWLLSGLFLMVTLGSTALGWIFGMQTAWNGQRVVRDVRRTLFGHMLWLPAAFYDRNPAGKLTTRVTTDVENLNELIATGVLATLFDLLKIVGVLAVLFFLDPLLALLALFTTPVVIGLSLMFRRRAGRAFHEVRGALAEQNGFSGELVGGVRTVRAFGREAEIRSRYSELNHVTANAWRDTVACFAQFFALVDGALRLATIGLLYVGGKAIQGGDMTIGDFVQFWLYYGLLTGPIKELGEKYNVLQAAFASAQRIFGILDEPVFPADRTGNDWPQAGRVDVRSVHYAYEDGPEVLHDVSLTAESGETIAIVGPTGAGKSTLIQLLARAFDPTTGTIAIGGIPLRDISQAALQSHVAVVAQDVFLFEGSILDNIRMSDRTIPEQRVIEVLQQIGAWEFVGSLDDGLQTILRERGTGLSQGQRQLIAFARALVADPDVLILDEATSSLDSTSELHLQRALATAREGRAVFVVAHRLATVRSADRILVLDHGEIVERGSHAELIAQGGAYARMVATDQR